MGVGGQGSVVGWCEVSCISRHRGVQLILAYSWQGGHKLWKTGKTGKMVKKIPCREKSGNLKFCSKSGKNQGISKNLIFVRSKYSNFIAVQILVVSFCHMLKIPADLILLKGGVLVRWSTCLLYILFFFFLIPKWTFYCKPNVCH